MFFVAFLCLISIAVIVVSPEAIVLLGSEKYAEAIYTTIPVIVGGLFSLAYGIPTIIEYYHKKTKIVAAVTIASSLLNVALNYVLIRAIGMAGAALATALSHGIQLLMHHLYCRKLGRGSYPFPVKVWAKYAVFFLGMMVYVYAAQNSWILRWSVGAVLGIFELLQIKKRKVLI